MAGRFSSPLELPVSGWSLSATAASVPGGFRYSGYTFWGIRAQRTSGAGKVLSPAPGIVRAQTIAGVNWNEIQLNPFWLRRTSAGLPWGLPTFYLLSSQATASSPANFSHIEEGTVLWAAATDVTILFASQDRLSLDARLWVDTIDNAIQRSAIPAGSWASFSSGVSTALPSNQAPVLVLDHTGQPAAGSLNLGTGAAGVSVTLDPADHGDLQAAVKRAPLNLSNLWSGGFAAGGMVAVEPAVGGASDPPDFQLSRIEDAVHSATSISLTQQKRHVSLANLSDWLAPQFAMPVDLAQRLPRYTRGNRLTPIVNGNEFFDGLFRNQLPAAAGPGLGFHLAGWDMHPNVDYIERQAGDPTTLQTSLTGAAKAIVDAGGGCRFLPSRFIQLEPASAITSPNLFSILALTTAGAVVYLYETRASFRTDRADALCLFLITAGTIALLTTLLLTGGQPLEPNQEALSVLNYKPNGAAAESACFLAPHPAQVEDNTAFPSSRWGTDPMWNWNLLFGIDRHFGIYHQKFGILKTSEGVLAYCGGIDLNPNRIDDAEHTSDTPVHDVHSRIEGPAVIDLACSFQQRWDRDGSGKAAAFPVPQPADVVAAGGDQVVQVARTYHLAASSSRALSFAPAGDRTIADTMLRAIAAAREFIYIEDQYLTPPKEYRDALLAQVKSGPVRKVIVTIPAVTDQPFGDAPRSRFIADLRSAEAARGGGIVRIGFPRRRFTVPDSDLRASSGKCLLGSQLPAGGGNDIVLGPEERLPNPPFWVAVEGELIWVYAVAPTQLTKQHYKRFLIDRGADTRLVAGGAQPAGPATRAHPVGAPATVIQLTDIYVHAKMMIVDDVFLGIGSANVNRRGLFHDGEINVFSLPEKLKTSSDNPVASLRCRLWAEMMDLPARMAAPLLRDPLEASRLLERSPLLGNRHVPYDARPANFSYTASTGDGIVKDILSISGLAALAALNPRDVFDALSDPSSGTEP